MAEKKRKKEQKKVGAGEKEKKLGKEREGMKKGREMRRIGERVSE